MMDLKNNNNIVCRIFFQFFRLFSVLEVADYSFVVVSAIETLFLQTISLLFSSNVACKSWMMADKRGENKLLLQHFLSGYEC